MTSPASSNPRSRSSQRLLRPVLLAIVAAAFFLVSAAQASAADFLLEVNVTGEGNVGCKADGGPIEGCEAEFPEGTQVTVIAEPETGSEFLEWEGECDSTSGNECEVEMNADKTIEAIFGFEELELAVQTEGNGEGVVECEVDFGPAEPCPASKSYPYGTEVTLLAMPEEGSEFVEWGGDCTGSEPECTLTLTEPLSATATFEPGPLFALNIEEPGSGEGTVTCEENGGPAEPCAAEYPQGTEVKMVAKAAPGSEFVEWGGECDVLTGNECVLTMSEEKTVEVLFELRPLVSLTVNLGGTGEGKVECKVNGSAAKACAAEYPEGTELALVAVAKAGSEFAGYSAGTGSAASCSTSPCAFTIEADSEVTATFNLKPTPKFMLKVKKGGTGSGTITSSPAAIECPPTCSAEFAEGTTIILTATPDPGSEFVEWLGCDEATGNECEETISAAKEVTAIFNLEPTPQFTLEVNVEGPGSVSAPEDIDCPGVCSGVYNEGETVTLVATPDPGAKFVEWTGCDEEPSATECEVTMNEDREVGAVFASEPPSEFALTVAPAGSGSGTVTSSPAGINCGIDCSEAYAAGTEVTLTATPASGSTFSGWSGACTGVGACKVTMSQARSVTATFAKASSPPPPPGVVSVGPTAKVKSGKALLKLTCQGEGPCKGSLKLTAKIKSGGTTKKKTIGKGSFSLAAGAKITLKVKLSGPAKRAVAKKPLKAKVSGSGVRSSTVKLKK